MTHFADDATLSRIAQMEKELAAAQARVTELEGALTDLLGHVVAGVAEKYPPKDWGGYPPPEVTVARAALKTAEEKK